MIINSFKWSNLNPRIKISRTSKKFYQKYLFRLKIFLPGAHYAQIYKKQSHEEIEKKLEQIRVRHLRPGGVTTFDNRYKSLRIRQDWPEENIYDVRPKHFFFNDLRYYLVTRSICINDLIRVRTIFNHPETRISCTDSYMILYSNDEKFLFDTVKKFKPEQICNIDGPNSIEELAVLKNDGILTTKDSEFKFKIYLRSIQHTQEETASLYQLLSRLLADGEIRVPNFVISQLKRNVRFYNNFYVLAKDDSIVTLLNLTVPDVIGRYHELVVIPK